MTLLLCLLCGWALAIDLLDDPFDGETCVDVLAIGPANGTENCLSNWQITSGSVDLLGTGSPYDWHPGAGNYLDLVGDSPGAVQSNSSFDLAGTYTLNFDLAGPVPALDEAAIDAVRVSLGRWSKVYTPAVGSSLTPVSETFVLGPGTGRNLVFEVATADGSPHGIVLDNVQMSYVPSAPKTFGERVTADVQGVTADTFIEDWLFYTNFGGSDLLQLDSDPFRISLLKFDLSAVPVGTVVASATLHLEVIDPGKWLSVYEMLQPWEEFEATYNLATVGTSWATIPAQPPSRDVVVLATMYIITPQSIALSIDPNVVQGWIDDPASNHGFSMEIDTSDGAHLGSSENAVDAFRPMLELTY